MGTKDELAAIAHQYVEQQVFAVQERVGGYPEPTPQVGDRNLKNETVYILLDTFKS